MQVAAFAPGRVNLIGEHTDYTGGFCLPMAVHLGVTVEGVRGGDRIRLRSEDFDGVVDLPCTVDDPASVTGWGRYVAGVVAELRPAAGFDGTVRSDLPAGAGLSSSAALEVAVALALGADAADQHALAALCQRAEQRASGVPCGILDQLASVGGIAGHALLMDCRSGSVSPIALAPSARFVVVHSGQTRELSGSEYATRRRECEAAEAIVGPFREATPAAIERLDGVLARRARHVITENERVHRFAAAMAADDLVAAGAVLAEGHASLRDDFDVSTPVVDETVARLSAVEGVYGVRLTGGGFGGCVVALTDAAVAPDLGGWVVAPGPGAHLR